MWHDDVLAFWFCELKPAAWFDKNDTVDTLIRERFGETHERLVRAALEVPQTPHSYLAAVIVLDQFSRNLYRGSPLAYANDERALALAAEAIDRGFDAELDVRERQFLYMPFMHSEDPAVQARSVDLFESLGDPRVSEYARDHRRIVDLFGRFPHRNRILGRDSTHAELEFMKQHPGF